MRARSEVSSLEIVARLIGERKKKKKKKSRNLGWLSGGVSRVATAYMRRRQLVLRGRQYGMRNRSLARADAWHAISDRGRACSAARAGNYRARP